MPKTTSHGRRADGQTTTTISLPTDLKGRATTFAKLQGKNFSAVVREMLVEKLPSPKKK
jgi:predicted DNA-binding protein